MNITTQIMYFGIDLQTWACKSYLPSELDILCKSALGVPVGLLMVGYILGLLLLAVVLGR
ncbi:hypothetical protein [Haladaptatus cibarius]|uniref:hypothetical protein n=1 Tax=Haladaptatus cibarius TaxID=453847 RepID=UPI000679B167|nr:hypothetical protein [Haladaptatus cibarius]